MARTRRRRPLDIDDVVRRAALLTAAGWLAGFLFYNWLSPLGVSLPWWEHLALIVAGSLGAFLVIGLGMATVGGMANKFASARRMLGRASSCWR